MGKPIYDARGRRLHEPEKEKVDEKGAVAVQDKMKSAAQARVAAQTTEKPPSRGDFASQDEYIAEIKRRAAARQAKALEGGK